MDPFIIHDLFGIEGFNIAWYGVIIGCGMIIATTIAAWRASQKGYKSDLILDFILFAIPVGIVCARMYYVAFEWEYYAQNLIKIFAIREGGLAIYGGVLGGIATAVVFCKYHKFSLIKLLDFVMPSLLLGQAIGRWGNFTNQEAFGNLITDPNLQFFPYGVYIEHLEEWHQATFFYESMANLTLFILMMIVAHKAKKDGWMLAMYFMGYGCIRFFIEGLRADSLYLIPGVRVSQVLSVILVIIGLGIAWGIRTDRLKAKPYDGIYLMNNASKSEEK
jgi:phosphatidylglycerol:prolipoprotein diacylglycerol transferase